MRIEKFEQLINVGAGRQFFGFKSPPMQSLKPLPSIKPMLNILLFIAIILTSCTSQKALELEVINSTFIDMVGTYYYNEPAPPAPYRPIHPDSIYNEIEGEIELMERNTNPRII